jgi:hypothetical protein
MESWEAKNPGRVWEELVAWKEGEGGKAQQKHWDQGCIQRRVMPADIKQYEGIYVCGDLVPRGGSLRPMEEAEYSCSSDLTVPLRWDIFTGEFVLRICNGN